MCLAGADHRTSLLDAASALVNGCKRHVTSSSRSPAEFNTGWNKLLVIDAHLQHTFLNLVLTSPLCASRYAQVAQKQEQKGNMKVCTRKALSLSRLGACYCPRHGLHQRQRHPYLFCQVLAHVQGAGARPGHSRDSHLPTVGEDRQRPALRQAEGEG